MSIKPQEPAKIDPDEALRLLDEAWAYYSPEPVAQGTAPAPELFEYYRAA